MELKDVIHYYLGCQVLHLGKVFIIRAINEKSEVLLSGCSDTNWIHITACKPLLRKLSSMTEEEGKAVFTIEKDRVLHETILDFDLSKRDHGLVIHRLDDLNVSMMMGFDGVCYKVVQDFSRKTIEPALNQPLIFAYLLKQRFDLFGLIESKQAIDINAKTEQQ